MVVYPTLYGQITTHCFGWTGGRTYDPLMTHRSAGPRFPTELLWLE